MKTLIQNATIINEGKKLKSDVLLENDLISKISSHIPISDEYTIINAKDHYLIPGVIDDQVHFREPGLTHKGDIESESKAAVAGGITSYIEQPNTFPNATTQELLEQKYQIAAQKSYSNYSFSMGGTNDNLDEILKTNPRNVPAIKLFLGSSTGNMLIDDPKILEEIFSKVKMPICVHCEDETIIRRNTEIYTEKYGEDIPMKFHPEIRSEEACYISSSKAVELAKKTGARLHIYHISTAKELELFQNDVPLKDKKITAEVCIHHLFFNENDYEKKGAFIKWNPAVKAESDQKALWEALLEDKIDVIATDHAPHTLEEKSQKYLQCPSGGPLVQFALLAMLEATLQNKISLEKLVEKMCHNPAVLFQIEKRGYIREGYKADLVLINPNKKTIVTTENILSKCGWSPFLGETFSHSISHTFINGFLAFQNGNISEKKNGERLTFDR